MKLKKKADYKLVYDNISIILRMSTIKKIPIDIFALVKEIKKLKLIPYSKIAKELEVPISLCSEYFGSKSGAFYHLNNKSIIYYNDVIDNWGHIRFTIAHELGHYLMNHKQYAIEGEMLHKGIPDAINEEIEKEADCFARNLLSPVCLMNSMDIKQDEIKRIQEVFDISYSAAKTRSSLYKIDKNKIPYSIDINKKYSEYILLHKQGTTCQICGYSNSIENAEFCCICGSSQLTNYQGDELINYQKYPSMCEECSERDIEYGCNSCGDQIQSYCFYNLVCENFDDFNTEKSCNLSNKHPLPAYYRYCPYCGKETCYSRYGIISSYKKA